MAILGCLVILVCLLMCGIVYFLFSNPIVALILALPLILIGVISNKKKRRKTEELMMKKYLQGWRDWKEKNPDEAYTGWITYEEFKNKTEKEKREKEEKERIKREELSRLPTHHYGKKFFCDECGREIDEEEYNYSGEGRCYDCLEEEEREEGR